ncbi:MAG: efflux transporter outer membrane subunit [Bacteroidetes bacterium]|nr:efflux transporter outer membrane subunit [Bacteroidota bacterium]NOG57276.1 efflux transporter outer membrane subunit [Bacteroidota bacterium]
MFKNNIYNTVLLCSFALFATACSTPVLVQQNKGQTIPDTFHNSSDSNTVASLKWNSYFNDPNLLVLIDSALHNNQEFNITMLEIQIAKNEVRAKKGEYLPSIGLKASAGVEKTARYTPFGANEATTEIEPGREMPEPVPDFMIGAVASWEVDIWHRLRNAKKSAVMEYLASVEGKNFMQTNLVAEIASSYYELLAQDNQLAIVKQNIAIQKNALNIVEQQKNAAIVTELAVQKFQAEVLKNRSRQFYIEQQIIELENKINFLVGRFPQTIKRSSIPLLDLPIDSISVGIPSQMLANRPDIKQAELELEAAKLDVKVARARFYPSLGISSSIGLQAFDPSYLAKTPESLLYSLAGDLISPLVNRNAIKAAYSSANVKQIQALYEYEKTVLSAYLEVVNNLSKIKNLNKSFDLKNQEVQTLNKSIRVSTDLFKSARADYMEVLMTQRDALESTVELIETKMQQMNTRVMMYKALGGGWN